MNQKPQKQGDSAGRPAFGEGFAAQTLVTLLIVLAATAAAVWLFHGLGVQRVAAVFLMAVLLASLMYGLGHGLIAALAAGIAFKVFIGAAAVGAQLSSVEDIALLLLFVGGSWGAGLYTDSQNRMRRSAKGLAVADTAHGAPEVGVTAPLAGWLAQVAGGASRNSLAGEMQRTFLSVLVVGAGALAAIALRDAVGGAAPALALLASVVAVAIPHGARFGFAAGILAVLALNAVMAPGPALAHAGLLSTLFELLVFVGIGWWVGRDSDRVQRDRHALAVMVGAGRELAATTDEAAVRRVLFDALVGINPDSSIRLADESGVMVHEEIRGATLADNMTWRTRRMAADDREVGVVYWTGRADGRDDANRDEIVSALVDLGASAIVRTRLGVEKAEIEFVARTEQLRTILLDAVSHHFRTPLHGIIGSVTSILNLPEPHDRAARRDLLLIIKEQANRLNRYVENFLSVARLESGSIDMKLEEIAVEPLLYDVWETFGEAGGARRFLHVKVDAALVKADAALLSQVFGNVLENAIKFSSEGSVVDVRTRREGDKLVFDISDQGCGVPPSAQTRIFERFFRSRGSMAPGLGLGLYITRSLVEMLGGAVEAHNRSDGASGLVVSIALPLAEAA